MLWFFRKFASSIAFCQGIGSRESGVGSREGRSHLLKAATEWRSLGWGNGELAGRSLFLNADELEGRSRFEREWRVARAIALTIVLRE